MRNQLKTFIFLLLLSALFLGIGYLLAGRQGAIFGISFAILISFIVYWFADKVVLSLHGAQEVHPGDSQGLYEIVARLSQRGAIPTPRVYLIPDHSPNAFATGRNPYHAAIAVTQGLMGALSYQELEGVIAHEVAHIRSRDTLIGSIAALMASAVMFFTNAAKWSTVFGAAPAYAATGRSGQRTGPFGILMTTMLAPIAATIVQFSVSRSREYRADAVGAKLCGHPEWLANALRKIHNMSQGLPLAAGGPATSHMYIVNPLTGSAVVNLFSTHPPVDDRIARLLRIELE